MGIFNFLKKKSTESSRRPQDNYELAFFGQVDINNLEEYYSSNFELDNTNISTDINFENNTISAQGIGIIEVFLRGVKDLDKRNKVYIEKDFSEETGETSDYINFYLDEFDEAELGKIIDLESQNISKNRSLLNKLKLIRVGLYPDGKFGASYFATFDYSIDIDGEPCNQLLVINTDSDGNLDHITWES